jgi:hypothetical protein
MPRTRVREAGESGGGAIYCSRLYLIKGHSGGVTHTKTMLSAVSVSRLAAWWCTNTHSLCMLVQ